MTQSSQSAVNALIESWVRTQPKSSQNDARKLLNLITTNLTAVSPGGNLVQPGGTQAGSAAAPTGVTFTAQGANGSFTISITNPTSAQGRTIFHEISYSPVVSFTQTRTVLPATSSTSMVIAAPGASYFIRLRSSFDRKNWSDYQLASSSAISAGLVDSAATTSALALNQTNTSIVNSSATGGVVTATVNGPGGALTSYSYLRGQAQAARPPAAIVGVTPGKQQFIGWDGSQYHIKPTLAGVLADQLEPVGAFSAVSTAVPMLPVVDPIIVGGGIVGFNVVSGGAGASQPYILTIFDSGGGGGATAGAQTIVGGVLISVAPGNAGAGYTGATTVTPSGGSGGGSPGGGTAQAGNGGRMTNV